MSVTVKDEDENQAVKVNGLSIDSECPQKRKPEILSPDRGWGQRFAFAAKDITDGAKMWRLIWALSFSDIKMRYRGSVLGPFWMTLSTGVQIAGMGFVYSYLFKIETRTYLPYLAISIIFWGYLCSVINDGCVCFTQSDFLIRGTRIPFSVYAARSVIKNTIVLAHNSIIIALVFFIMKFHVSLFALYSIPVFLLWMINGFFVSLLCGALCARFRDITQIIASVIQIAFFITPIMWLANELKVGSSAKFILVFNPFYYLLEILRSPIFNGSMEVHILLISLAISIVLIGVSFVAFARARGRIAFWI
jgi:lipopolysaccharide transport system permease protein